MRRSYRGFAVLALVLSLTFGSVSSAFAVDPNTDGAGGGGVATDTAIITLVDQPTASYDGHLAGYPATKPGQTKKLALESAAVKNYRAYLAGRRADFKQWMQRNGFKGATVREYDLTVNGLAVRLNGGSIDALRNAPGVASVEYSRTYTPAMNVSLDLIKAGAAWAELGGRANAGRGVKVGVIDSGIDEKHPFFNPAGFSMPAGFPKNDSRCRAETTPKVIVARVYFYNDNRTDRAGLTCTATIESHGTHVAGTIGGVEYPGAAAEPYPVQGILSGVAPGVWLGNYNVFPANEGLNVSSARSEDITQAVEDAVADGMDVLNLSLGGVKDNGLAGPDVLVNALNHAADAGVVAAVSAGNEGPGDSTIGSPGRAERVITVAASTNRHYIGIPVTVGGRVFGAAVGDFNPFNPAVTAPLAVAAPANGCTTITRFAEPVIAIIDRGVCSFTTKVRNAEAAGAVGVLVVNSQPGDPAAMAQDGTTPVPAIPAAMVARDDGPAIKGLAGQTATVNGTAPQEFITNNQNIIAGFSSTGPVDRSFAPKPDITAPGVNIYSSFPGDVFGMLSGTSMAAPHVAGSAALLLQQHQDWTPEQVKSALFTTGQRVVATTAGTYRDPGVLRRGGGLVDLDRAPDVTAAFSPSIVGFGQNEANGRRSGSQTVTVTNLTAAPQTYSLSVAQTAGAPVTFGLSTTGLTVPAGGSATFTVTMSSAGFAVTSPAGYQDFGGDVIVSGGGTEMRLPLFARFK